MIYPTLRALAAMGSPYKGVLFAGVMLTEQGPKLVEYNARFGDPECQVLMLRMMSDIVPALIACADGQLKNFSLRWFDDVALTVIMATKGYPGDYGKGFVIEGLDDAAKIEGVEIFHAGTRCRRRQDSHQWRARAERLRHRQDRHRSAAARLCSGRPHQMAGRFLPPRHRLAGGGAGEALAHRPLCSKSLSVGVSGRRQMAGSNCVASKRDGANQQKLSSPLCKNISVFPKHKSPYILLVLFRQRGARDRHGRGMGCGGRWSYA